jgi:hypothetical protein
MRRSHRAAVVHLGTAIPEVVAGIVNDGSAGDVATAAVSIARQLRGRVRFVHVLPDKLTGDPRAEVESAMFSNVLRALHGQPRVQAAFEAPTGDPVKVLVERSRAAIRLVVGADRPHPDARGVRVAAFWVGDARWGVHVVPLSADAGPLVPDADAPSA